MVVGEPILPHRLSSHLKINRTHSGQVKLSAHLGGLHSNKWAELAPPCRGHELCKVAGLERGVYSEDPRDGSHHRQSRVTAAALNGAEAALTVWSSRGQ